MIKTLAIATGFVLSAGSVWSAGVVKYPGVEPGRAHASLANGTVTFSNHVMVAAWALTEHGMSPLSFRDVPGRRSLTLTGEVFQIVLTTGTRYPASRLVPDGKSRLRTLIPRPKAARFAARLPGKSVEVPLRSADGRLRVLWRGIMLDGAHYLRQEIELAVMRDALAIQEIVWLDTTLHERERPLTPSLSPAPSGGEGVRRTGEGEIQGSKSRSNVSGEFLRSASTAGRVDGSPIVADSFFLGSEDPMAENLAGQEGSLLSRVRRNTELRRGETLTQSFVLGVAPAGQMRRAFLGYLERERAHPFRPFLHYNSWYDISWPGFSMNETNCLAAIHSLAENLIHPHSVVLDGVVFDDGWDDPKSLWQFHAGFPRGFAPPARLCRQEHTHLGVWLSPFGGYGKAKEERLRFGRAQDYETNATGFSLAGPKYYDAFRKVCLRMMRTYGVVHFKFDGIASGMYADGAGAGYVADTEALRRLMLELREEDPAVYINFTTGSWPSPFWLRYADSLWRQGDDMGFSGKGNKQQQWLTYRDQEVRKNIVGKGPLFPLNSLMTQGVAWSRHGSAAENDFDSTGFKDDVRMFFGSGTSLQELYIRPQRLGAQDWQVLAEAAKWSRAHADVLVDTHWIGGDPAQLEVYGYAAWSPRAGIVALRNPDDQPHPYELDVASAFELPPGAAAKFTLHSPWAEDSERPVFRTEAGTTLRLTLKPFEVLILDASPVN
ncbi:MAG: enterotoxin [Verrucomicrobia bacterium]|nr:enterotoxin [Verrucomicrobiota bacterium]